jgi:predicted HAD superfamily Cof-like phosphohydrolase
MAQLMTTFEHAVFQFMYKHGLLDHLASRPPGDVPTEVKLERLRMLTEELSELAAAMHENAPRAVVADALGDLFYVLVGTFIAYGIPLDPVFEEIHRSNMTKSMNMNANLKPVKGPLYEPPRLQEILASWPSKTNK